MHSSPSPSPFYRASPLHAAIERWQQFVLSTDELQGASVFRVARQLVAEMPQAKVFADEVVARAILAEMLSRLIRQTRLVEEPQLSGSLVRLVGSLRCASWATDALALLDDCAGAIEAQQGVAAVPPRVRHLLRELDTRYRESLLDEPSFAEGLGKSASYVAHVLKRYTGRTFL